MFYGALIVAGVQYSEQGVGGMVSAESLQERRPHFIRSDILRGLINTSKDSQRSVECSKGGRAK